MNPARLCPPWRQMALVVYVVGAVGGVHAQLPPDPFPTPNRPATSGAPAAFEPLPIFFPPQPPPLGRAIARSASPVTGRLAPPPELAAHVNDIFYPALSTRLVLRTLPEKLRTRLEQYRAAKLALQDELRAELDRLRDAEPSARIEALQALARRQTPVIAELEHTAEQLRRDLITSDTTWSALREWRLGDNDRRGYSPLEIAQVMRGYAYYHPDLLPVHRRLLREIALELLMAGEDAQSAAAAQPHLFFPPEPARVLLPDNAPAEVAAKMATYQGKKSALKKELYDAVHAHDGRRFAFLSTALKKLAAAQAPRVAELERLAEEIRTGLAQVPEPARVSERSPVPPRLQARIAALLVNVSTAQKEATARLQAILAAAKDVPVQASYRFESDGLKYTVIASRRGRGAPNAADLARIDAVRADFTAVANDYGHRLAELVNEKDAITAEIAAVLGTTKPATVNQALAAAVRVAASRENEEAYRDYRIAVFQPGLSPEQRRLLFDSVMVRLELPLPRGELQPKQRAAGW